MNEQDWASDYTPAPTTQEPPRLLEQVIAATKVTPASEAAEAIRATIEAEVDIQVATAKKYPRNLRHFRDTATTLATLDEKIAGDCYYKLPRGGKRIEGPSIRLAEIVAYAWGNLRTTARVLTIDKDTLTVQAMCHDLETNIAVTKEVRRRITDKTGQRYNDDMIATTANAAMSIAIRNAIFSVVPFAHVKPIYDAAKRVSVGSGKSFAEQREAALKYFRAQKISDDRICAALNIASIDDMTADDLVSLRGLYTAIKDGEATLAECFPEPVKPGVNALAEKLQAVKVADLPPVAK